MNSFSQESSNSHNQELGRGQIGKRLKIINMLKCLWLKSQQLRLGKNLFFDDKMIKKSKERT